jgi:hypothetical protein
LLSITYEKNAKAVIEESLRQCKTENESLYQKVEDLELRIDSMNDSHQEEIKKLYEKKEEEFVRIKVELERRLTESSKECEMYIQKVHHLEYNNKEVKEHHQVELNKLYEMLERYKVDYEEISEKVKVFEKMNHELEVALASANEIHEKSLNELQSEIDFLKNQCDAERAVAEDSLRLCRLETEEYLQKCK